MGSTDIRARLIKSRDKVLLCKITRDIPGTSPMDGFVLGVGKACALIHFVFDFRFDGYSIVPIDTIASVRFSSTNRFFKSVMKKEGILADLGMSYALNLDSMRDTFNSLAALKKNIIVEIEHPEYDLFLIGKILRLNKKTVSFRGFDALGKWDEEYDLVPYDAITHIGIDKDYTEIFSRHLKTV